MKKHFALIILVIAFVYANSLSGDFVWDDHLVIVHNDFVKSPRNLKLLFSRRYLTHPLEAQFNTGAHNIGSGEGSYRPVATLSYFADYALFGLKPLGFRLTNVAIHITNALLLYLLLNALFGDPLVSLFAAVIFGIHPVNAEVLNCTAFRPGSLGFLCGLSSLLLYFRYRGGKSPLALVCSLFFFFLALFTRENAVFFIPALILCEYYASSCRIAPVFRRWRTYLWYGVPALAYLVVYFLFFPPKLVNVLPASNIGDNLLRMFDVLGLYLKDLALPLDMLPIPSLTKSYPRILLGIGAVLFCVYIAAGKKKPPKEVSFGVLWFFLWLLPANNFLYTLRIIAAYRFLYVPFAGLALVLAVYFARAWSGSMRFLSGAPVLRRFLPLACLAYFSICTAYTNTCWRNTMTLCLSRAEKYPGYASSHIDLGMVLSSYRHPAAARQFELVLSRFKETCTPFELLLTYGGLGNLYRQDGRFREAQEMYEKALQISPHLAYLHTQLGIACREQGLHEKALEKFAQAKEINPFFTPAYIEAALTYELMQKYPEAEAEYRAALEKYPDARQARDNLMCLRKRLDKGARP